MRSGARIYLEQHAAGRDDGDRGKRKRKDFHGKVSFQRDADSEVWLWEKLLFFNRGMAKRIGFLALGRH